jgi:gamma-glutamylcyclotransferase (GGCT)/AIG2-like uncharacterized protein YtfP
MSENDPRAAMDGEALFAYGTLRFPEILEILLGRVPDLLPASVPGWRVRALPGAVYPGMVADPGGVADGVLISGLTEDERRLLDAYEDAEYEPRLIPLGEGDSRARAYVWTGPTERYDWDPVRFAERDLTGFAEDCRAWREGMGEAGRG